MLKALEATHGIVSKACRMIDLNRSTHYDWYNNDANYKKAVDDLQNVAIDFVEDALFEQISNGNHVSTIFYLKCKGKNRGYIEQQDTNQQVENLPTTLVINTAPKPNGE